MLRRLTVPRRAFSGLAERQDKLFKVYCSIGFVSGTFHSVLFGASKRNDVITNALLGAGVFTISGVFWPFVALSWAKAIKEALLSE